MKTKLLDNEREELPHIDVSFGMRARTLIPREVTKLLGVQPTHAFQRGDEFDSHSGKHRRDAGVWQLRSEDTVSSANVDEHVRYILDILEPKRNVIEVFLKNPEYYVEVRIHLRPADSSSNFSISSEMLTSLALISQHLNISCVMSSKIKKDPGRIAE
jgi:hypothetical protein